MPFSLPLNQIKTHDPRRRSSGKVLGNFSVICRTRGLFAVVWIMHPLLYFSLLVVVTTVKCDHTYKASRSLDSRWQHLSDNQRVKTNMLKNTFAGYEYQRKKRGAAYIERSYYWNEFRIPYVFWPTLLTADASRFKTRIDDAMYEIEFNSCLRFVKKNESDADYVVIYDDQEECYSEIGRQGGAQITAVGKGCSTFGSVLHELLHTVGMWHTTARLDRDQHVAVLWDNLDLTYFRNFLRVSYVTWYNETYDTESIMHYGTHQFSRNGLPTILPHASGVKIGQRRSMSEGDKRLLNKMYPCKDTGRCGITGACVSGVCKKDEGGYSACTCKDNWYGEHCHLQCPQCSGQVCPESTCLDGTCREENTCSASTCSSNTTRLRYCSKVNLRPETRDLQCSAASSNVSCSIWKTFNSTDTWTLTEDHSDGFYLETSDSFKDLSSFSAPLKRLDVLQSNTFTETGPDCRLNLGFWHEGHWWLHSLQIMVVTGHRQTSIWSTSLRLTQPSRATAHAQRDVISSHRDVTIHIGAKINFSLVVRINLYEARRDFAIRRLVFEGCDVDADHYVEYEVEGGETVLRPEPLLGYFPPVDHVTWFNGTSVITSSADGLVITANGKELGIEELFHSQVVCFMQFPGRTETHVFNML